MFHCLENSWWTLQMTHIHNCHTINSKLEYHPLWNHNPSESNPQDRFQRLRKIHSTLDNLSWSLDCPQNLKNLLQYLCNHCSIQTYGLHQLKSWPTFALLYFFSHCNQDVALVSCQFHTYNNHRLKIHHILFDNMKMGFPWAL